MDPLMERGIRWLRLNVGYKEVNNEGKEDKARGNMGRGSSFVLGVIFSEVKRRR
jgi:hypothetical protein